MTALFGTDGIRGEAGVPPLDEPTVRTLGGALAAVLTRELGHSPRVVVGRDTRESGPRILSWLADGLVHAGASVRSAGVLPTPAVAFLARQPEFDAGIVVSASHNAWQDNGLKVFSHGGVKLADSLERAVEREAAAWPAAAAMPCAPPPGDEPALRERHGRALAESFAAGPSLAGFSLVIDCAHGAASGLAGDVLAQLGARTRVMFDCPDGRNINDGCGSVHPGELARAVVESRADAGIAFDGDADRCILVDDRGRIVDGDHVLLACADDMARLGTLRGGGVVGTVMSNFGLERALEERGLRLVRESVGDRNVLERMQREGYNLGGEPSGHVIFLDDAPTGDGLLTAVHVLQAAARAGRRLSELADLLPKVPQVLRNVRVRERRALDQVDGHAALVDAWAARLHGRGRLLVRWSGTERLVRVMAEGADERLITECVDDIAANLVRRLGGA